MTVTSPFAVSQFSSAPFRGFIISEAKTMSFCPLKYPAIAFHHGNEGTRCYFSSAIVADTNKEN